MGLSLTKVHEYQKVPGKMESRLVRESHYVRIVTGGRPPVYCQHGVFYSEGDQVIPREQLPEGYWIEARRVTPEMRKVVGLILPEELSPPVVSAVTPSVLQAPPVPAQAPNAKFCALCGQTVEKRAYGAHIMRHRRRDKAVLEG